MNHQKNFYQILHVQQDAALINEAYSVLMNSEARAKYDASLAQAAQASSVKTNDSFSNNHASAVTKKEFNASRCSFCDLPHNYGQSVKSDSLCQRCASSLFPASKQSLGQSGKRIIQRIEKQWPVTFYMHWSDDRSYMGKTQDVSLNGIQMLTNTFVENGQVLKLSSHTLDAVAVVVNYRSDHTILLKRWRVGLEFLTLRFHQAQGTFIRTNA
ncbi:MAG: PilZ domain-containing protein [Phycisphaeraceae bacterium]|nr:PilZ domain-containing protein [Phycisphaeraceae bacterium]